MSNVQQGMSNVQVGVAPGFFVKVVYNTLEEGIHVVLLAQPTEILGTKLELSRQRALGLVLGCFVFSMV